MLEVQDVQYFPDGRSVVDAVGGRRFRVLSRSTREGYNTAVVKFLRDEHVFPEEQQGILFFFLNCVYTFSPLHAISLEIFFIIYLNMYLELEIVFIMFCYLYSVSTLCAIFQN